MENLIVAPQLVYCNIPRVPIMTMPNVYPAVGSEANSSQTASARDRRARLCRATMILSMRRGCICKYERVELARDPGTEIATSRDRCTLCSQEFQIISTSQSSSLPRGETLASTTATINQYRLYINCTFAKKHAIRADGSGANIEWA